MSAARALRRRSLPRRDSAQCEGGNMTAARYFSEEKPMNASKWVRQIHRWLSIAFTVTVIVTFVALAQ